MIDIGQHGAIHAAGANRHAVQRPYVPLSHKGHQSGGVRADAFTSPDSARHPAQLPHLTAYDRYRSVRRHTCSGSEQTRRNATICTTESQRSPIWWLLVVCKLMHLRAHIWPDTLRSCLICLHMIDIGQYDAIHAAGANGQAVHA